MLRLLSAVTLLCLFSCSGDRKSPLNTQRPNILLIVADDMAYSDMSWMGSSIQSPNLDKIRSQSTFFSQFHTAPSCAPTRAMLLTGNDNHVAGMGRQSLRTERWGYENGLSDRVQTIPQVLSEAGYQTAMVGKWHIGYERHRWPDSAGFQKHFALHMGAGNHYNGIGLTKDRPSIYTENGLEKEWPEGAYSTDFYTEKLIEFLKESEGEDKPFFAYAAYTSPHWPLQVDSSFWLKYEVQYKGGYDSLRKVNLENLKRSGLIPQNTILPEKFGDFTPWDSLSSEEKKIEVRKMALYAGMVENLDQNIGRLVSYLKNSGQWNNTILVFMSDNGAAPIDFYARENHSIGRFTREVYDNSYENMGRSGSFVSYGLPWAEAGSAMHRAHKYLPFRGGNVTPMLLHLPGQLEGSTYGGFVNLTDLAPSFYDWAGIENYEETAQEEYPLTGVSLKPLLAGEVDTLLRAGPWIMEHSGSAIVRDGAYRLVQYTQRDTITTSLFNENDLGERFDLKEIRPEVYGKMREDLKEYFVKIQVDSSKW